MNRLILLAAFVLFFFASTYAEARRYNTQTCVATADAMRPDIMRPCARNPNFLAGVRSIRVQMHREHSSAGRTSRHRVVTRAQHSNPVAQVVKPVIRTVEQVVNGIVSPLAQKVAEIQSSCGSRVISGVRHTYIAGTRRISLHASGKAVDMSGNPSCMYMMLANWPGGYSTDYGRMGHIHISYDSENRREWGARFVHGGGYRHYAHRHHRHHHYARHRHQRYASR